MAKDKDLKTPNVPPLRFPGFTDKWKESTIGNVVKIGNGRDYKHLGNGSIPVFGTGGYMTSVDDYLYDGETVFIGRKGSIDKPFYFSGKFWTVDTLFYTYDFNGVIPKFLYSIFQRINWKKYNEASGVPSLSKATIEKIKFKYPLSPEQDKISRLLSLIDERIATQNKIIEDLKKLKSAISAQLYEGHYITDNSNGWKIVRLGDITENFSIRNKNSGSYPMYSVTNTSGFSPQHEVFEGKEIKDEDISIYKIIHKGEFAYNPARINVGSIGRYDGEAPCMISSLYVCFRPTAEVDSDWLLYYLQSAKKIYQYGIFGEGGVRIYLFYPNFSRIEALLPPLKVQKEIASILKSFNRKIKLDELLLSKYQEQKKFLLSNMFI